MPNRVVPYTCSIFPVLGNYLKMEIANITIPVIFLIDFTVTTEDYKNYSNKNCMKLHSIQSKAKYLFSLTSQGFSSHDTPAATTNQKPEGIPGAVVIGSIHCNVITE